MFTIRLSVDDLSPFELCEVIENRMKELRGEYDVVALNGTIFERHFPGLIFKVVKLKCHK